ncbi:MAG: HEPN domain-containing protein [Bacteroidia bacterium]
MKDIGIHIKYWLEGSDSDIETAEILIKEGKYINELFFCHLSVEKMLKAHVVKTTKTFPSKTHNLFWLSEKAKLQISEQDIEFMGILMKYQLEGRYPDYSPGMPKREKINEYLCSTKEILKWLKKKL